MAKQGAEGGQRLGHDAEMRLLVQRSGQDGLAEAKPVGAKFAFDLGAMKVQGNFKSGEEVFAEEDAVTRFHVEELNGENVGGTYEFVAREQ